MSFELLFMSFDWKSRNAPPSRLAPFGRVNEVTTTRIGTVGVQHNPSDSGNGKEFLWVYAKTGNEGSCATGARGVFVETVRRHLLSSGYYVSEVSHDRDMESISIEFNGGSKFSALSSIKKCVQSILSDLGHTSTNNSQIDK